MHSRNRKLYHDQHLHLRKLVNLLFLEDILFFLTLLVLGLLLFLNQFVPNLHFYCKDKELNRLYFYFYQEFFLIEHHKHPPIYTNTSFLEYHTDSNRLTPFLFLDFLFPDFALGKSNPCDNLFFRSSIILSKSCFPVSGGVAGVSPAEGVAEDSLLAEARGRLSPSTLLINFQLTHPKVSHHVIENQSIPHDKFRFRHTKALIHFL